MQEKRVRNKICSQQRQDLGSFMQRISITVDEPIAEAFDRLIAQRGYKNRSEAFRDLLRNELAKEALMNPKQECVAVVSYAYDHHKALLSKRSVEHQHDHLGMVVCSMHVHATKNTCVEAVIAKGPYAELKKFCEQSVAEKGVGNGKINYLPIVEEHSHSHSHDK